MSNTSRFKVGDRVMAIKQFDSNHEIIGQIGTVITQGGLHDGYCIEFDKDINGHCDTEERMINNPELPDDYKYKGNGHSWNCAEDVLSFVPIHPCLALPIN